MVVKLALLFGQIFKNSRIHSGLCLFLVLLGAYNQKIFFLLLIKISGTHRQRRPHKVLE